MCTYEVQNDAAALETHLDDFGRYHWKTSISLFAWVGTWPLKGYINFYNIHHLWCNRHVWLLVKAMKYADTVCYPVLWATNVVSTDIGYMRTNILANDMSIGQDVDNELVFSDNIISLITSHLYKIFTKLTNRYQMRKKWSKKKELQQDKVSLAAKNECIHFVAIQGWYSGWNYLL